MLEHPTDRVPTWEAMRRARLQALEVLVRNNAPLLWQIGPNVCVTTDHLGNPKGILTNDLSC